MKKFCIAVLVLVTTAAWSQSGTRSADLDRIQSATTILSQIMEAPDRGIPDSIMSGAKCIAIVPSMLKISFIFGANYGKGIATCRTATGWSTPAFFRIEGGSFGFQAGGQASDLVLIIRTDDGMQHLLQSKFKLGADASAAAGPVGRDTQAATDLTMRAQVLTYSRSRGLFLGVSLSGAVIRQDDGDVLAFYGKDWTFYSLLNGEVPPPPDTHTFLSTVERYAPTQRAALPAHPCRRPQRQRRRPTQPRLPRQPLLLQPHPRRLPSRLPQLRRLRIRRMLRRPRTSLQPQHTPAPTPAKVVPATPAAAPSSAPAAQPTGSGNTLR